jgi:hypothetical protein
MAFMGPSVLPTKRYPDGEVLATLSTTAPILAGAYHDLAWVWEDVPVLPGGAIDVFAIVDAPNVIDEFDEDNNVRSAIVSGPTAAPGDLDFDGDVDLDDFSIFAGCMGGPGVAHPGDYEYADLDGEGDVDLADFASFQEAFTG